MAHPISIGTAVHWDSLNWMTKSSPDVWHLCLSQFSKVQFYLCLYYPLLSMLGWFLTFVAYRELLFEAFWWYVRMMRVSLKSARICQYWLYVFFHRPDDSMQPLPKFYRFRNCFIFFGQFQKFSEFVIWGFGRIELLERNIFSINNFLNEKDVHKGKKTLFFYIKQRYSHFHTSFSVKYFFACISFFTKWVQLLKSLYICSCIRLALASKVIFMGTVRKNKILGYPE